MVFPHNAKVIQLPEAVIKNLMKYFPDHKGLEPLLEADNHCIMFDHDEAAFNTALTALNGILIKMHSDISSFLTLQVAPNDVRQAEENQKLDEGLFGRLDFLVGVDLNAEAVALPEDTKKELEKLQLAAVNVIYGRFIFHIENVLKAIEKEQREHFPEIPFETLERQTLPTLRQALENELFLKLKNFQVVKPIILQLIGITLPQKNVVWVTPEGDKYGALLALDCALLEKSVQRLAEHPASTPAAASSSHETEVSGRMGIPTLIQNDDSDQTLGAESEAALTSSENKGKTVLREERSLLTNMQQQRVVVTPIQLVYKFESAELFNALSQRWRHRLSYLQQASRFTSVMHAYNPGLKEQIKTRAIEAVLTADREGCLTEQELDSIIFENNRQGLLFEALKENFPFGRSDTRKFFDAVREKIRAKHQAETVIYDWISELNQKMLDVEDVRSDDIDVSISREKVKEQTNNIRSIFIILLEASARQAWTLENNEICQINSERLLGPDDSTIAYAIRKAIVGATNKLIRDIHAESITSFQKQELLWRCNKLNVDSIGIINNFVQSIRNAHLFRIGQMQASTKTYFAQENLPLTAFHKA